MNIAEELLAVIDQLDTEGIPYALCGGIALSIHGYVRVTEDIDLLVMLEDVDRIKDGVREIGFRVAAPKPLTFDVGTERERTIFRISKFEGEEHLVLDLIVVTPFFTSVWRTRARYQWEGREIQVVSVEGLIQMKRAAGRKQDLADLERLEGDHA